MLGRTAGYPTTKADDQIPKTTYSPSGKPSLLGEADEGCDAICIEVPFDTIGTAIGPSITPSQLIRCSPRPWPLQ